MGIQGIYKGDTVMETNENWSKYSGETQTKPRKKE